MHPQIPIMEFLFLHTPITNSIYKLVILFIEIKLKRKSRKFSQFWLFFWFITGTKLSKQTMKWYEHKSFNYKCFNSKSKSIVTTVLTNKSTTS
jgi:hypothetical protein